MAQFTLDGLRSALRKRIGNPDTREAPDRELDDFLQRGWEWAAAELELTVTTDTTTLALVAGTQEYTLPTDLLVVLWAEWNEIRLKGRTTFEWDRDGTVWRNAENADTLVEFALEGQKMIFSAPPSATAVTADSAVTVRYYANAAALATSSTAATALGEGDQMLPVYAAAVEWLGVHPERDQGALLLQANAATLGRLLVQAKRRVMKRIADYEPGFAVSNRRAGIAR